MDDARLEELTHSIKANGVIQPIVVRKVGDTYQIIAGERRWRAALKAGLLRVPVVVREVASGQERSVLEMALIENIQREDLNPIDEALAYRRLADEFQAEAGRHRRGGGEGSRHRRQSSATAQAAGGGSGRGRVRHPVHGPRPGAARAADRSRTAARRARGHRPGALGSRNRVDGEEDRRRRRAAGRAARRPSRSDVHTRAAEERLRLTLGTRVRIVRHGTRGRIEIDFVSEDELIRIYEQLNGS